MTKKAPDLNGIKVCLVFPPYQESRDEVFLGAAKKNLGKIPPLSLCAVAAVLERHGCRVKIIDANAANLSCAAAADEAAHFCPDFLGFTISTYQFHFTLAWIKEIRARVSRPVVVGGPHARAYARELLGHPEIDYCVLADAEESLPLLIGALVRKADLAGIGGIAYRDGARIAVNDFASFIKDLDTVPFPSRHLLDNRRYYSLISRRKNFTAMTTSRGCVFDCTFCDNHCIPYRAMGPVRVVDEMEVCVRDFGIGEIDMFDGVFSVDKTRILGVCEEIRRRRLTVRWSIRARADLVDREMLSALRSAGCVRIYYGIESGSPVILQNIKKGMGLERIRDTVRLTRRAGIETFGFFMLGAPGETPQTIEETARLMLTLPLDYVQIAPIFYPPQTELYAALVREGGIDYWGEYTRDPGRRYEFPLVGTAYRPNDMRAAARSLYLRFYLRPRQILRLLVGLKMYAHYRRCLRALFDMLKEPAGLL